MQGSPLDRSLCGGLVLVLCILPCSSPLSDYGEFGGNYILWLRNGGRLTITVEAIGKMPMHPRPTSSKPRDFFVANPPQRRVTTGDLSAAA